MKLATPKKSPEMVTSYGSVGRPAGPTTAPIGRFAAVASVAGAGAVPVVAEAGVAPVSPVVGGADSVGGGVAPEDSVPGAGAVEPAVAPPELESLPVLWASSMPRKSTPARSARPLTWTSIEAESASSGTALPSTTRRP